MKTSQGWCDFFSKYCRFLFVLLFLYTPEIKTKLIEFSRLNVNLPLIVQEKQSHLDKMSSGLDRDESAIQKQYKAPL